MSEIEKLPQGWSTTKLSEIASLIRGISYKKAESIDSIKEGYFGVLRATNINNGTLDFNNLVFVPSSNINDNQFLIAGDVVIAASSGSKDIVGKAGQFFSSEKVSFGAFCSGLRPDKYLNQKYFGFYFQSHEYRHTVAELSSGSNINNLKTSDLSNLSFPVAPVNEQSRIVDKLEELFSELDAGVKELKAAQTKLSQYRQSLLKSAVEGSLTQQWRAENSDQVQETGEQLLARILKQRREQWQQQKLAEFAEKGKTPPKNWQDKYPEPVQPDTTDLPELPEGWVWASLGQCFKVEVGATPSRKQPTYWGGEIPWVSSGEVQFGRIKDTKEKITKDGLKNSSTQINPKGSVLLGMIGEGKTRGQSAILDIDAANNQNCAALWVPNSGISSEYVFYWLWSQYEKTRSGSSGNNQPALNKSLVEKMPIAISSIEEMAFIGNYLSEAFTGVDKKMSEIIFSLNQSEAQRKNILKSAFSGQLVPQDPNDEPASVLLEKIKQEREALAKKPKTKHIKTKSAMKKITVEELTKWVSDYEGNSFTFGELQKTFQGDYDQLKDCVFEILSDKESILKQVFDQKLNVITFIKEDK
ncbi:restriction endonuclease subunit S [Vibrio cholerae]|uniref:restriction endonuclease subunit S n=1 Tax=Vibrio cholerae TaxID=666 RepID=UPI002FE5481C